VKNLHEADADQAEQDRDDCHPADHPEPPWIRFDVDGRVRDVWSEQQLAVPGRRRREAFLEFGNFRRLRRQRTGFGEGGARLISPSMIESGTCLLDNAREAPAAHARLEAGPAGIVGRALRHLFG
jgi:hypothetical protein